MKLRKYLERAGRGAATRLIRESGVAASTVYDHLKSDRPICSYPAAKRISLATKGKVSIEDLCEPVDVTRAA